MGPKAPPLVPDWAVTMQMRTPNPPKEGLVLLLIGPKSTDLIDQNRVILVGWSYAALIGGREASVLLLAMGFQ